VVKAFSTEYGKIFKRGTQEFKIMKSPYLGRINLRWCRNCNLPVLGRRCSICSSETEEVAISPPGDVRPAFLSDIELINSTTLEKFGYPLINPDRICLLNKSSGFDRFDEIIQDGIVVGSLYYDLEKRGFSFLPSLEGASRLYAGGKRKFVEVKEDVLKFLEKGSVLMPGVESFDESIETGDSVIVISMDRVVGVGKARFSGKEAEKREKGMFVKLRRFSRDFESRTLSGKGNLKKVIEANLEVIDSYEREALDFIKSTVERNKLPVVVAFSGGKDSLATLLLVDKATENYRVLFTDTGIEFPETIKAVRKIVPEDKLLMAEAGDRFFKGIEVFGFPARDYRWCCKVIKLGPTAKVIKENFPEGCLSFIGQRRYESEARSKSNRVWRNPWLPFQLGASPIQNWTALHVWLYIVREGVEINELYFRGFERIGCWACPGSEVSELMLVKDIHSDLYSILEENLLREYSREEAELGLWRWRSLPSGQRQMAENLGINLGKKGIDYILNYSEERGKITVKLPEIKEQEKFVNMLLSLGRVERGTDYIEVKGVKIFDNSVAEVKNSGNFRKVIESIIEAKERSELCLGCGICLAQCKNNAIELDETARILPDKCSHCSACHNRCPVVRYRKRKLVLEKI